jgi:hypothetical protein
MSLAPGIRLGPYEVLAPIGAGGMGEVWRATDTNLKRQVALKVLPEAFSTEPDRQTRFQREAQVLAALNHPNIAQIHGVERTNGVTALVMELVEGPTLADRIAQGPIPIDEALSIAKQIAEALEVAHEQGIIHRDLKPRHGLCPRLRSRHVGPSREPVRGGRPSGAGKAISSSGTFVIGAWSHRLSRGWQRRKTAVDLVRSNGPINRKR